MKDLTFGIHAVLALLNNHPDRVNKLYLLQERHDQRLQQIRDLAFQHEITIEEISREKLNNLLPNENHQGVAAAFTKVDYHEDDLPVLLEKQQSPLFILILDGIQDPHNLGACLRSANAAGVQLVIAPRDKSAGITPVVQKVACGATEVTPFIQVTNLARTLKYLKEQGVWIFGTSGDAESSIFKADLKGSLAIVLGSEGKGLRHLTKELCDYLVKIPMNGTVESLNVSVATGICLFEAARQRNCIV